MGALSRSTISSGRGIGVRDNTHEVCFTVVAHSYAIGIKSAAGDNSNAPPLR